ncbi:MAG: PEGA domain-containing protein [Terriglobia bacterium]|jgi:hypothetical protein
MRTAKLDFLILIIVLSAAVALTAKDPADYPLRVELLGNNWHSYRPYPYREPTSFRYRVTGRGNVEDGPTLHAVDFTYDCAMHVPLTVPNETYLAKWKKPQLQLEVLVPVNGKEGKYETCEMQTTDREGVYLKTGQGLIEVSQEDYKARKAPPETSAVPPTQSATVSKLSVTSNPDNAEIEVDGELMGTTPSVLDLSVGEHTIVLRKTGYKLWQRRMKVVTGEIKLNGDLEPENPQ